MIAHYFEGKRSGREYGVCTHPDPLVMIENHAAGVSENHGRQVESLASKEKGSGSSQPNSLLMIGLEAMCLKIMASKGKGAGTANPIPRWGLNGDREPWQPGDAGIPFRPTTCCYIAIAEKVHQLDIVQPENGSLVNN